LVWMFVGFWKIITTVGFGYCSDGIAS
jgi:hypothetical protein